MQSLNTAFAPPASCDDVFSTTSATRTESPTLVTVFASVPSDHPGCQPSGYQPPVYGQEGFTCTDCVCPSGWTAYDLRMEPYTSNIATCCSKGFTPLRVPGAPILGNDTACVKTTTMTSSNVTALMVSAHPTWQVVWYSSKDKGYLTPAPPKMLEGDCLVVQIKTWTPGNAVSETDRVPQPCGATYLPLDYNQLQTPGYAFIVIGIPIISVFVIATICFVCVRRRNRKLDREDQAKADAAQTTEASTNIKS